MRLRSRRIADPHQSIRWRAPLRPARHSCPRMRRTVEPVRHHVHRRVHPPQVKGELVGGRDREVRRQQRGPHFGEEPRQVIPAHAHRAHPVDDVRPRQRGIDHEVVHVERHPRARRARQRDHRFDMRAPRRSPQHQQVHAEERFRTDIPQPHPARRPAGGEAGRARPARPELRTGRIRLTGYEQHRVDPRRGRRWDAPFAPIPDGSGLPLGDQVGRFGVTRPA